VLLGVSMAFPFLKMTSGGVENAMNLLQTVSYLEAYGADTIATLIFAFVIVVPAVVLVIAVIVAGLLEMRFFPGWMVAPTRWLFHLNPWSMVEVFSLSVIVSLVKLSSMASVDLGIAFWAYLLFTATFLMALSSLDRMSLWLRIEAIRGRT
jgi:paraquat-inducible protein A